MSGHTYEDGVWAAWAAVKGLGDVPGGNYGEAVSDAMFAIAELVTPE